jgi:hypothetical protein
MSSTERPLWEVMHEAQMQQPRPLFTTPLQCYAAEIRAFERRLAEGWLSTSGQRLFAGDRDGDVVGQPGHCAHGSQLRPNLIQVVAMDNTA